MTTKLIYTSPKRKIFVQVRDICLLTVIVLSVLFRKNDLQSLFERIFGHNIGVVILYFFFAIIIILIFFYFLSRRKKRIGELKMSIEMLTIQLEKSTLSFNIEQLTNFSIKTSYFIPHEDLVGLYSSYNNWLYFEYMNINYQYQFIIDSVYKGNQFEELVTHWKNNDNFTLIEEK